MFRVPRVDPRAGWAIGSGVLLGMAFPGFEWSGAAWLAPGLMLFAGLGRTPGSAFRLGYLSGLAFSLVSLSWLLCIPVPVGPIVGWLALSLYVGLFFGAWTWVCWRLAPGETTPEAGDWRSGADRLLAASGGQRLAWALMAGLAWVAIEMVRARLFSGFPWSLLGVSQYRLIPLIQIASVLGVYGVSFLVAWSSVSLGLSVIRLVRQPVRRWGWLGEFRLPLVVLVTVITVGLSRSWPAPESSRVLTLALVQPSIPQAVIWDMRQNAPRFARLLELSELALATKPDVLIWPEAALPAFSMENYRSLTNLTAAQGAAVVFGADDAEPRRLASGREATDYFNSAFLLNRSGRFEATYRKQRLVIFGEYIPLVRWLPFLRWLAPIGEGFTPGKGPVTFALREPAARLSVLICFEDVFPHGARRHVTDDVDFLLNLTNDGWFRESAAQWQHAANAVFRAVENGLPLVRCTNNGLTCWIDAQGRLRRWLGEDTGDIYAEGFLSVRLPLGESGTSRGSTFYRRYGDVFGWGAVVLTVVGLGGGWVRGRFGGRRRVGREMLIVKG